MADGRGAALIARAAAQLRDRSGVTTTGDCQVGDRLVSRDRDRLADLETRTTPLAGHNGNGQAGRNGSDNPGSGPVDGQVGQRPIVPVVTGDLADDQIQGLEQMREEEKLAHDVYLQLGEQWNAAIFAQIAQSESQHMAAVGSVLDRYGLDDPIDGYETGEFPTPAVQDLYDSLVARGRTSLEDAYQVGATIEDMDIYDLQELLDSSNLPSDVARVYENLERGSRNHLRAFVGQIEAAGETYVAQFLDADQINEIVSTPIETGGAGRDGGRVDRPNRQRNASGPSPAQDRHDTPRWPILD